MKRQRTDSTGPVTSAEPITVLHVDDDPSVLDVTKAALEDGYDRLRVHTARDVRPAVALLDEVTPDCVVSESTLPTATGVEFYGIIRRYLGPIPFILFTREEAPAGMPGRVSGHVGKSDGREQYVELARQITTAVERRWTGREPGPVGRDG